MRFYVPDEHRMQYQSEGFWLCEELLDPSELALLSAHLWSRVTRDALEHELWKRDPAMRGLIGSRKCSEVMGALTRCRGIRLLDAFWLPELSSQPVCDMVPMEPVLGGLLIDPISGNGCFVQADRSLIECPIEGVTLLIVYGVLKSQYLKKMEIPDVHRLKRFGYGFGDRLKEADYPVVWRG